MRMWSTLGRTMRPVGNCVYRVQNGVFLDPYGDGYTTKSKMGVWFKHSRQKANCPVVPVKEGDQLVALLVISIKDIAEGEEL